MVNPYNFNCTVCARHIQMFKIVWCGEVVVQSLKITGSEIIIIIRRV